MYLIGKRDLVLDVPAIHNYVVLIKRHYETIIYSKTAPSFHHQ